MTDKETDDDRWTPETWKKFCHESKKEELPIERYCYDIRGVKAFYDLTFEELQKQNEEEDRYNEELKAVVIADRKQRKLLTTKPEGMTNAQWKKQKSRLRRLSIQTNKDNRSDLKLEMNNPMDLFESEILSKIGCKCKAEELRQGLCCNTCRLIIRVKDYTLNLFKDASQGRSTVI